MNDDPSLRISATISADLACGRRWDAIVIGAGPAGTVAARQLAADGLKVLVVDKRAFPRDKVCGGCVSPRAARFFKELGLGGIATDAGAVPIERLLLSSNDRQVELPLHGGWAVSRFCLDAELLRAAIRMGADFLDETTATVEPVESGTRDSRVVTLMSPMNKSVRLEGRVIVAADGLGSPSTTRCDEFHASVDPHARIGLAATLTTSGAAEHALGTIYMTVARGGYVGRVRFHSNLVHVGAAVDPDLIRHEGGIHRTIGSLLGNPDWWPSVEEGTSWQGTRPLTRRVTCPASYRVLQIGDAAGYIEPFTGEGIAWAIESAMAVQPFILAGIREWSARIEADWSREYARRIGSRQASCFRLTRLLRSPRLTQAGMMTCQMFPAIARFVSQRAGAGG